MPAPGTPGGHQPGGHEPPGHHPGGGDVGADEKDFEGRVMFHDYKLEIMPHEGTSRLMFHGARDSVVHNGASRLMIAETS